MDKGVITSSPAQTSGGGGGGSPIYSGQTPTNIEVGGIPVGTDLTGFDFNAFIEILTIDYLNPSFSSFLISGQSTLVEVGTSISGNKTFNWATTNSINVQPNSIIINDVTGAVTLLTGGANDGSEILPIGTVVFTPTPYVYRVIAQNTNLIVFQRDFTINTTYPYFFGKVASGGAPSGSNRPAINQALIDSGTKVVGLSTGTVNINFNSTSDDYIWFAIPFVSADKNTWYVTPLNNGAIGGAITPSGNLFPNYVTLSVTTVNWAGVNYKVYLSNYQTASNSNMELRN